LTLLTSEGLYWSQRGFGHLFKELPYIHFPQCISEKLNIVLVKAFYVFLLVGRKGRDKKENIQMIAICSFAARCHWNLHTSPFVTFSNFDCSSTPIY